MTTYIGFSTIGANQPKSTNMNVGVDNGFGGILKPIRIGKKYRLVDENLVVQDFINALNIRQGEKVGQPGYGTTLWSFVFEPNDATTQFTLEGELRRVASLDPRLQLNSINVYNSDHGILVEIELAVVPFNNAQVLSVFFDSKLNTAILQ